ncbi:MAG: DinB family protein [Candidatus Limnocylindrales bacterium]
MVHPRVDQLRFARAEWVRGLRGLSEADAARRLEPMNAISWMIGHLAWHERLIWLERGLGLRVEPVLDAVASGQPASTPSLDAMWASWKRVTGAADSFLDALTTADLLVPPARDARPEAPSAGSQLQRITYHYWSHIGEASAVRQILGHKRLAQFVGSIERQAPYRAEDDR